MEESGLTRAHLSRMETAWTCVHGARGGGGAGAAREAILLRYGGAARRYLAAMLRDDAVVDDVYQEFALKLLRGDFGGADPARGRFRDLVRTALRNLVKDAWRRGRGGREVSLEASGVTPDAADASAADFGRSFREEILARTWSALERFQKERPGNVSYDVLRLRALVPEATSEELAAELSRTTGGTVTPASLRQSLRRARDRFAELLLAEVAFDLDAPTPERLAEEVAELGLAPYCADRLEALRRT